jgi:hypothetical protein
MDGSSNGASPIRRVASTDIPWMLAVAEGCYPDGYYEPQAAARWLEAMLASETHLMLRGTHAFMTAIVADIPWAPQRRRGMFGPVASDGSAPHEILNMTQEALAWAKGKGACDFYFGAVTGVDFGPLARRFGGRPVSPYYVVDL